MALKTSINALDMLAEESEWIIAVCLAGSMYMVTLISVQVTGEILSGHLTLITGESSLWLHYRAQCSHSSYCAFMECVIDILRVGLTIYLMNYFKQLD